MCSLLWEKEERTNLPRELKSQSGSGATVSENRERSGHFYLATCTIHYCTFPIAQAQSVWSKSINAGAMEILLYWKLVTGTIIQLVLERMQSQDRSTDKILGWSSMKECNNNLLCSRNKIWPYYYYYLFQIILRVLGFTNKQFERLAGMAKTIALISLAISRMVWKSSWPRVLLQKATFNTKALLKNDIKVGLEANKITLKGRISYIGYWLPKELCAKSYLSN